MSQDPVERLEKLVARLLDERAELLQCKQSLTDERDRLQADRARISGELDSILTKMDRLEGCG